ncbi:alpha/beta hydrolase [Cellulomonas dongxiuzhuiae]|uniref:alpha/beta hydrolase n=1 Tax=Cellulomonas dongxiuzhuiae TaxID=2819979 RepID=UPI002036C2C1|nr:alpha/beta hydrolase [Cellulomonas dongxiuzhuiae]
MSSVGRRRRSAEAGRRPGCALLAVLAVVALVVTLVTVLQRTLVYFPDRTDVGTVAGRVPGARDLVLRTDDGLDLAAWLVPPAGEDREVAVLYLPGNGGNRLGRLDVAREIAARGFTVLLLEYRGYGGNPGRPSEQGLARDARAAAAALRDEGFDPARTLYVGESIGTGVASRLATTDPPAGLLLRSPFTSLVDVGRAHYPLLPVGLILRDRFPSAEHLGGSEVPVRVLHGSDDDVVPSRLSAELAARVGNLQGEVVVPGAGHNDAIWFGPRLADEVVELAEAVVG